VIENLGDDELMTENRCKYSLTCLRDDPCIYCERDKLLVLLREALEIIEATANAKTLIPEEYNQIYVFMLKEWKAKAQALLPKLEAVREEQKNELHDYVLIRKVIAKDALSAFIKIKEISIKMPIQYPELIKKLDIEIAELKGALKEK